MISYDPMTRSVILIAILVCVASAKAAGSMGNDVVTVSADIRCTSPMVVPAGTLYRFVGGAKIINAGGCSIAFRGAGLVDPLGVQPVFAGFSPGQIEFTGSTGYPSDISAELWGGGETPIERKYANADSALKGKRATIRILSGVITAQLIVTDYHTLSFGPGDFPNKSEVGPQIVLNSNTRVTGAAGGRTTLRESSSLLTDPIRFVYGAGVVKYPFSDSIHDVEVDHLRFYSDTDKPFDSALSAVFLGNVIRGTIHDCEFDSLHGFGAFVGGFADPENTGHPHYAEDCEIYNNLFENLGTQEAGVIQGRNIRIHDNRFKKIGRIVKQVSDGVTNGSDTVTSLTARFPPHYKGTPVSITKPGQPDVTANITAVRDPRTIILSAPVPYSASGVSIQVHSPMQAVIDLEPNHPNDILEDIYIYNNVIDAREAVYYTDGIVAQVGGALATRNIHIENNQVIGCDLMDDISFQPRRELSIGILLVGGNGAVVSGNTVSCTGQSGISIYSSVRSSITGNNLAVVGGGGNPGMQVIASSDNSFSNNRIRMMGTQSQDASILETELNGVVDVSSSDGSASIVTVRAGLGFSPFNVGSQVMIGTETYPIIAWIDLAHVRVRRTSGGPLTAQPLVTRYNSNKYSHSGQVVRSQGSFSAINN